MQGFINVYKPSGCTSNSVVSKVKKKLNISKVGHMGTLDPMAEGVLVLAVGKATRMFDYFLQKTKSYRVKMKFGVLTDTLDITGKTLEQSNVIPSVQEIKIVLPKFVGVISQVPPNYSAKNVNGTRAYDLARSGKEFELKPCNVTIDSMQFISYNNNELVFDCVCGSGTYIRSLVRDIAGALGTYGTMTYLCRLTSGSFTANNAVDIDKCDDLASVLIPIDKVFGHIEKIDFNKTTAEKLSDGQSINSEKNDGIYFAVSQDTLLGVVLVENKKAKLKTYLKE